MWTSSKNLTTIKEKTKLKSKKLCLKAMKHAATPSSSKSTDYGDAITIMNQAISIRESAVGRYTDPLLGGMYYELAHMYQRVDNPNTTRYWMVLNVAYRIQCRCIGNSLCCYDSNGRFRTIRISRDDMPGYPLLQHSIKIEVRGDLNRFQTRYTKAVKDYASVIQWEKKMIYNGVCGHGGVESSNSSSSSSSSCPTIAYLTRKIFVSMACLSLNLSGITDWDTVDRINSNGPLTWLKTDEQTLNVRSCDVSAVLQAGDSHLSNCNYNEAIDEYRTGMVGLAQDSLQVRKLIHDICSKRFGLKLQKKQQKTTTAATTMTDTNPIGEASTTTTTTTTTATATARDSSVEKEEEVKHKLSTSTSDTTSSSCTRTRSRQRPLLDEMHAKILEIIQKSEVEEEEEEETIIASTDITRDEDHQQQRNHHYDDAGNAAQHENKVESILPGKTCLKMFVPYSELSLFLEKKEEEK